MMAACACRLVRGAVMEFRLLGHVEVWAADRRLELGPPQRRAVLAALAVHAGRPLPRDTLVSRVWPAPECVPDGAVQALHSHLSHIRGTLESAAARPVLVRQPAGYVLEVDPEQVDLHRFRRLALAARDRQRPDDERARMLREALGLWRGEPLADLPGKWAAGMRDSWNPQRLDATVAWAQAVLRLGRPDEVISPVRELVAGDPLDERLIGILMRALAAAGRNNEALECYATSRSRVNEELGAEPGPQLQMLHLAILRGELPAAGAAPISAPVPAQLPPDVRGFTGRDNQLDELDRLLNGAGDQPTAVVISAIAGTAG